MRCLHATPRDRRLHPRRHPTHPPPPPSTPTPTPTPPHPHPSSHTPCAGPNANLSQAIATYYAGTPCGNRYWNLVDAVANYAAQTTVHPGLPSVTSTDTSGFPAAIAAALAADVVVLALGQDGTIEHEAKDRTEIGFTLGQLWLIGNITSAALKKPVIAVVMTGGAVDVSPLLANPMVGAVVHAGQPSVQVLGVGDILFGAAVPAGRMSQTIYPADYVNAVSMFEMSLRPGPSAWPPGTTPGRTYKFLTTPAVVPFGFGLSYTTFAYAPAAAPRSYSLAGVAAALRAHAGSALSVSVAALPALQAPAVAYTINVTNTGAVDADDVVLGFLVPPGAGENGVPLQQLFGFARVHVPAGATVPAFIGGQTSDFTQVLDGGARVVWPGSYTVRFGVRETAALGQGFLELPLEVTV